MAILTAFTAAVFIISGLGKLSSRRTVETYITSIGIVARGFKARAAAANLIAAELAIGILLFIPPARPFAAVASAVFGLAFVAVHVSAMRRGIRQSCRCFGSIDDQLYPASALVRAVLLCGIATPTAYLAWTASNSSMQPATYALLTGIMAAATYTVAIPLIDHGLKTLKHARNLRIAQLAYSRELAVVSKD